MQLLLIFVVCSDQYIVGNVKDDLQRDTSAIGTCPFAADDEQE